MCFDYQILLDELAEGCEAFVISLQQVGSSRRVEFDTSIKNITIRDKNGLFITYIRELVCALWHNTEVCLSHDCAELTIGLEGGNRLAPRGTRQVMFSFSISGRTQLARPIMILFYTGNSMGEYMSVC